MHIHTCIYTMALASGVVAKVLHAVVYEHAKWYCFEIVSGAILRPKMPFHF